MQDLKAVDRVSWISAVSMLVMGIAGSMACKAFGMEQTTVYGTFLGVGIFTVNIVVTLCAFRYAAKKSPTIMTQIMLAMYLQRMLLFSAGLLICSKMDNVSAMGFSIAFIIQFFVFLLFEVWYVSCWNKILISRSQGE